MEYALISSVGSVLYAIPGMSNSYLLMAKTDNSYIVFAIAP